MFIPGTPVRCDDAGIGARKQPQGQACNAGPVNKGMNSEREIRRTPRQGQTLSGQLINAQPTYAFAKTMSSRNSRGVTRLGSPLS